MVRCSLLLCAQGVIRDADDGSLSVFRIIEGAQVVALPIVMPQLDVLALLGRDEGDPTDHVVRFEIALEPDLLIEHEMPMTFQDKLLNRTVLHVQGFLVPRPGVLTVRVLVAGAVLASYNVRIDLIGPTLVAHQDSGSVVPQGNL